jgi:hypothetical protein
MGRKPRRPPRNVPDSLPKATKRPTLCRTTCGLPILRARRHRIRRRPTTKARIAAHEFISRHFPRTLKEAEGSTPVGPSIDLGHSWHDRVHRPQRVSSNYDSDRNEVTMGIGRAEASSLADLHGVPLCPFENRHPVQP